MALVVIVLCVSSCQKITAPREHAVNKDQIEESARIKLPATVQDLHVHTESGIDTLVVIRFTMQKNELETFLKDAGYTEPLRPNFRPFRSQELQDIPWWNPDAVREPSGGLLSTEDWASELMVDTSDPRSATVYLKAFDL